MIGMTTVHCLELIKFPIKKTKVSYVRIYDSFHIIDQINGEGNAVGKIGELRVILYLEDLGPAELLDSRDDQVVQNYKEFVKEELQEEMKVGQGQNMESQGQGGGLPQFEEETFQQTVLLKEISK